MDCKVGLGFRLNKIQCKADALISAQYGTLFTVGNNEMLVAVTRESLDLMSTMGGISSIGEISSIDNRNLDDNNKAQSLDATTIREMKLRGESGVSIIEALAAGSTTWNSKTEFSKAKWLKRKAKKYIPWVQILEPTAISVTEAYFWRAASSKKCRPDTIAQLLARSNIRTGSRVIVVDSFHGVILGAVTERAGSTGNILFLYEGPKASTDAVNKFNFSSDVWQSISIAPADVCFAEASKVLAREVTEPTSVKVTGGLPKSYFTTSIEATAIDTNVLSLTLPKKLLKPRLGPHVSCRSWFSHKAHALVLAPDREPISVLKATLPALFDSCPLVVYSEHMEPLIRAFDWLKTSGNAIHLQLTETWLREFQILENRSHPTMTMCANAGFVLSAIKIATE